MKILNCRDYIRDDIKWVPEKEISEEKRNNINHKVFMTCNNYKFIEYDFSVILLSMFIELFKLGYKCNKYIYIYMS